VKNGSVTGAVNGEMMPTHWIIGDAAPNAIFFWGYNGGNYLEIVKPDSARIHKL